MLFCQPLTIPIVSSLDIVSLPYSGGPHDFSADLYPLVLFLDIKCPVLSHYGITACRERRGKAPQFLNLGTMCHRADLAVHVGVLTFV